MYVTLLPKAKSKNKSPIYAYFGRLSICVIYLEYGYNFVVDMSNDKNLLSFVKDVTNLLDISFEIGENGQIAPEALASAKWATLERISVI